MKQFVWVLALILGLSACATSRISEAERLQIYQANAGEPIRNLRLQGALSSWQPLGNRHLVVWTTPSRAYLLELNGICSNLPFTNSIALTNRVNTVSATFDSVVLRTPGGPAGNRQTCRIREIRPVDNVGVRDAKRERREVQLMEREDDAEELSPSQQ